MPYNPALSYTGIEQLLNAQEMRRALGQPGLTETQLQNYTQGAINAMYSPWIQAQSSERRFGQELSERQREFDIQESNREKQAEQQATMQTISGATQLAGLGAMGYMGYKMLKPAVDTTAQTALETAAAQRLATGVPSVVPAGAEYVPAGAVEGAVGGMAQAEATGAAAEGGLSSVTSTLSAIPSWGWAGLASGALTGATTGDWGKAAATGTGTAAGAYIGSTLFPGVGTVIGGLIGGLAGNIAGGSTVICTELYHQHLISRHLYDTVHQFTDTLPFMTKIGYYTWANHVVRLMKKSRLFTRMVYTITLPIMHDIASRVSHDYKPNRTGRTLYNAGEKLCNIIGSIRTALLISRTT
jgi:hypothetical protein